MALLSIKLTINAQSIIFKGPYYIDFSLHKTEIIAPQMARSDIKQ
jgi:hypothetical protein